MMVELLQLAIDDQWSGQANTSCHCHPEYTPGCPQCCAREYDGGEHTTDCSRNALITEVRAFLQAENDLAEARGEDTVWIP